MPEEQDIEDYCALVALAKENPYRFFSFAEAGKILGLGGNTMTAIAKAGAPVIGKKVNPSLLLEWLKENSELVEKSRK